MGSYVFPAGAGVILFIKFKSDKSISVPCGCRGDPGLDYVPYDGYKCSLRVQG